MSFDLGASAQPVVSELRLRGEELDQPRRVKDRRCGCGFSLYIYSHSAHVPAPAANAVQVAKMCDAFRVAGAEVLLALPRASMNTRDHYEKIAREYGFGTEFPFRVLLYCRRAEAHRTAQFFPEPLNGKIRLPPAFC